MDCFRRMPVFYSHVNILCYSVYRFLSIKVQIVLDWVILSCPNWLISFNFSLFILISVLAFNLFKSIFVKISLHVVFSFRWLLARKRVLLSPTKESQKFPMIDVQVSQTKVEVDQFVSLRLLLSQKILRLNLVNLCLWWRSKFRCLQLPYLFISIRFLWVGILFLLPSLLFLYSLWSF